MNYYIESYKPDELYHFGVKGMRWGVRRYTEPNGKLTAEGKKRYNKYKDQGNIRQTLEWFKMRKKDWKREGGKISLAHKYWINRNIKELKKNYKREMKYGKDAVEKALQKYADKSVAMINKGLSPE